MVAEKEDIEIGRALYEGLRPDVQMTVTEWADTKHRLPDTASESGPYKSSRTPYLREIMDKLSVSDPTQKVVVQKGSQLGFTEAGNIWVGYIIDQAPAPTIFIMPTDAIMRKTSKQRIGKMIDEVKELRAKIGRRRAKDTMDNLLYKEFPGGYLSMIGANSPVGLASTPACNLYADETDRYPESVDDEGSALALGETRLISFGSRAKRFITSTPKIKGQSQIEKEFLKTGQRYYHVPCPECGEYQVFSFDQLKYEIDKYDGAMYECIHCRQLIGEYAFKKNMAIGEWRAKFPEKEDGYAFGYHISAMYSPYGFYSWPQMAREKEESRGDKAKEIVFTNTKLGETYEEETGEKADWESIYKKAYEYDADVPFESVAFITAGVDVQKDRLEVEVVGWMPGRSSQSLNYIQIVGDTSKIEVWDELTQLLNKTYIRQGDNAIMPIRLMAVDTGYNTEKVYDFTQKHSISRVIPVKGDERISMFYAPPKTVDYVKAGKKIGKVQVWRLGVGLIKSEVYGFLRLEIDIETGHIPNGYCHFPQRNFDYFKGLASEKKVQTENKRGYEQYQWVKVVKRNEPLDCRVYARAAAAIVGMDRWSDERWKEEANKHEIYKPAPAAAPSAGQRPKKKRSDFWDR